MSIAGKNFKIIHHTSTEVPYFDVLDESGKSMTDGWGWTWEGDEEEGWEWLTRRIEKEGGKVIECIWS